MVPNMMSMKQKSTRMLNMIGKLFRMVYTRLLIPGIELIVLRGRRILITLIAEIFWSANYILTQPNITTVKSSYNKYEYIMIRKPQN